MILIAGTEEIVIWDGKRVNLYVDELWIVDVSTEISTWL